MAQQQENSPVRPFSQNYTQEIIADWNQFLGNTRLLYIVSYCAVMYICQKMAYIDTSCRDKEGGRSVVTVSIHCDVIG